MSTSPEVPGFLRPHRDHSTLPAGYDTLSAVRPCSFMLIAGEPSGDQLGAELVTALGRSGPSFGITPRFFGSGGSLLAAAGTELLTELPSVIGLWEVVRKYAQFRHIFQQLLTQAIDRRPDAFIGVDYGGFNLRFAQALRRRSSGTDWNPRLIQFVSPQVWATRPGRARVLEANHDLLLSILPFEKEWYARHAPHLPVEFVGHPIVDRHGIRPTPHPVPGILPQVLLLPGSRPAELERHLPVLLAALARIRNETEVQARLILPNETLASLARAIALRTGLNSPPPEVGGLGEALSQATLALASTGTVALECAWFQVPTLALYRTSWSTYQIGRRLIRVRFLAMPNLLADRVVMPEFIQNAATPDALAAAAIRLLQNPAAQADQRTALAEAVRSLGPPGAAHRAATAILRVVSGKAIPTANQ